MFNTFKKLFFLAHFHDFLGKNFFSLKNRLCHAQFPMPKFKKKLKIQFQENAQTDGKMERSNKILRILQVLRTNKFNPFHGNALFLYALKTSKN